MADSPFTPYVKSITAEDPMMKRVPMQRMDIGANSAGMPSGMMDRPPGIEHVGGNKSKG